MGVKVQFADVKKGMPAYDEETFGPVSAIITVKDEAEAIAVANDSRYGLGGSVWTRDSSRGEKIARQIETGTVVVNNMTVSNPRLPFGGVKKSGYGRELSDYGIKEFCNIKTISSDTPRTQTSNHIIVTRLVLTKASTSL